MAEKILKSLGKRVLLILKDGNIYRGVIAKNIEDYIEKEDEYDIVTPEGEHCIFKANMVKEFHSYDF